MKYPNYRARRMRRTENLRRLVQETRLSVDQLIMPYFVQEGIRGKEEIQSMPGQFRFSLDALLKELESLKKLQVKHLLLFGIPKEKDAKASSAYHSRGVVQNAIRRIKKEFPRLTVISDVCLCEYMNHGHCGVVRKETVDNDATLPLLAETALSHADAGADIVAPSDMMDGRIGAIRRTLDQKGFTEIPIMSYAAKYASAFYGPFREAAHSRPSFGNRKSYQMDPANREEALREIQMDLEEGADMVMVKPALPYLDVIREIKSQFRVPVAAYQVSGEYAMIKAASKTDYLNERNIVLESLLAIVRSGANAILTYYAKDAARWLREEF
ncbi:MAG: porphobilinogen synthase [Candidatus Omnitrophica bacterium]|nr:porphobilinogen synthase [Candidatus Omnitrophota bacterium]